MDQSFMIKGSGRGHQSILVREMCACLLSSLRRSGYNEKSSCRSERLVFQTFLSVQLPKKNYFPVSHLDVSSPLDTGPIIKWMNPVYFTLKKDHHAAPRAGDFFLAISVWPRIKQEYPPNLSILFSGGKETNRDSLSSGERNGISPIRIGRLNGSIELWFSQG